MNRMNSLHFGQRIQYRKKHKTKKKPQQLWVTLRPWGTAAWFPDPRGIHFKTNNTLYIFTVFVFSFGQFQNHRKTRDDHQQTVALNIIGVCTTAIEAKWVLKKINNEKTYSREGKKNHSCVTLLGDTSLISANHTHRPTFSMRFSGLLLGISVDSSRVAFVNSNHNKLQCA